MKTIPNKKLTDNFWLYEFIEANLPPEGIKMNWDNIDQFSEKEALKMAEFLQKIRELINIVFRDKNGNQEIGIRITSGWRCKEWELFRNRSGKSQHVICAADIQPTNCSNELAVEIIKYLYHVFSPRETGHKGGFAIKEPTYKDGQIVAVGFAHFDLRKSVARWEY